MSEYDLEQRLAAVEAKLARQAGSVFRPISPLTARNPLFFRGQSIDHRQIKSRIRRLGLPIGSATIRSGTPALAVQGTNTQYRAWAFDATAVEEIACEIAWPINLVIPSTGNQFTIDVYWTNLGAGSGDVRWDIDVGLLKDGALLNGAGLLLAQTTTSTAPPQDELQVSTITANQFPTNAHSFGMAVAVLRRKADDAGDTLANDAGLIGVTINYTADM